MKLDVDAPPYRGMGTLEGPPPFDEDMLYRPVEARGGNWL
jgi:hypothetical protein